ncbi:hypothetical protein FJT64_004367 [Amphibalanus amphitrite]|uniref:Uncharacterized protein n=1 Tax=Amphibalanus amphitrite TaxID=1232801 RepID=A0A6A4W3D3_AMPAM|nr:hypothetical protein FJT64_004367 [Amphibalanus amphitrite]
MSSVKGTDDHVVVRATDDVTTARVVPSSCSDHDLVVAETRLKRERSRPAEITVRSTRGLVPDQLRLELLLADWAAVYGATSTEEKWAAWLAVWTPVVDRHMPVVKRRGGMMTSRGRRHRGVICISDPPARGTVARRGKVARESSSVNSQTCIPARPWRT